MIGKLRKILELPDVKKRLRKVSSKDKSGMLVLAIQDDDLIAFDMVMDAGVDVNKTDVKGTFPLSSAVLNERERFVIRLLEAGADPNLCDTSTGRPALAHAAQTGNCDITRILLAHGAEPNPAELEVNALLIAVMHNHTECVQILLDAGSDTNLGDAWGSDFSALCVAACCGNTKMLDLLLDYLDYVHVSPKECIGALSWAACEEQLETMQKLLSVGVNIDSQGSEGLTTLMYAAARGKKKAVQFLLQQGADINKTSPSGAALHAAVSSNQSEIVEILLENGADIDVTDDEGWTALNLACKNSNMDIFWILLNREANLNLATPDGITPLFSSVANENLEMVKTLLARGAHVEYEDGKRHPPLQGAAFTGNGQILDLLLQAGAQVDFQAQDNSTPLMVAAMMGQEEIVQTLLNTGADVNCVDNEGNSALIYAIEKGNLRIVEWFVETGADVNLINKRNETPLTVAAGKQRKEIRRFLKKHGAIAPKDREEKQRRQDDEVRQEREWKEYLAEELFRAVDAKDIDTLREMLELAEDVEIRNPWGLTPFMVAVGGQQFQVADLLIEKGADVNAVDDRGCNALTKATILKNQEAVRYLRENGCEAQEIESSKRKRKEAEEKRDLVSVARENNLGLAKRLIGKGQDVNQKESGGHKTPLLASVDQGHFDMAELLLESGADPNLSDGSGYTPLMVACHNGSADIANLLLFAGADVDHAGHGDVTALMLAVKRRHLNVVNLLLTFGASIDMKDSNGRTALDLAKKDKKAVQLLEYFRDTGGGSRTKFFGMIQAYHNEPDGEITERVKGFVRVAHCTAINSSLIFAGKQRKPEMDQSLRNSIFEILEPKASSNFLRNKAASRLRELYPDLEFRSFDSAEE